MGEGPKEVSGIRKVVVLNTRTHFAVRRAMSSAAAFPVSVIRLRYISSPSSIQILNAVAAQPLIHLDLQLFPRKYAEFQFL